MARPNDDSLANDDAGSHALNRSGRNSRGGGGRRRLGRGRFLGNGLGRGHHGLLGGGLLKHISTLMTLLGILKGLFKHHKKTIGRGGRHRQPRKGKILRASSARGIRRPGATRPVSPSSSASSGARSIGAATPGGPGGRTELNFYRGNRLRTITGPFRMRLP